MFVCGEWRESETRKEGRVCPNTTKQAKDAIIHRPQAWTISRRRSQDACSALLTLGREVPENTCYGVRTTPKTRKICTQRTDQIAPISLSVNYRSFGAGKYPGIHDVQDLHHVGLMGHGWHGPFARVSQEGSVRFDSCTIYHTGKHWI